MGASPVINKKSTVLKKKTPVVDDDILKYKFFYFILFALIFLINFLFQKGVSDSIIRRSWGLNNFSYFPWGIQLFVLLLLFLVAIPTVNNRLQMFIKNGFAATWNIKISRLHKIGLFLVTSFIISIFLYCFRIKYDLLGDMNLRIPQTVKGDYVHDEYFTMYLLHYINIILEKYFHFIPHQTFVFCSIASGFLFSFFGLLIADQIVATIGSKMFFFFFYLFCGSLLFFCGYVEIYAFPALAVSVYIYVSLLYLKNKIKFIFVPLAFLIVAVALHLEQIFLFPSLLFLVAKKYKFSDKVNIINILLLFFLSVPTIYFLNNKFVLTTLTPLTKDHRFPDYYTLLSISHIWEWFNSQFLGCAASLFLFIIILIKVIRKKIFMDEISKFLLCSTIFGISLVFVFNKMRGSGDWDICSFPSITLNMFVAYIMLTQFSVIYSVRKCFYILSLSVLFNALCCLAWIGINSRANSSLAKITDMLVGDPAYYYQTHLPAEMGLAFNLQSNGLKDKSMEFFEISYKKYRLKEPRAINNYANRLLAIQQVEKAIPVLEDMIQLYPGYINAYPVLFSVYEKEHMNEKKYALAKRLAALYDKYPKDVLQAAHKDFLLSVFGFLYQTSLQKQDAQVSQAAAIRINALRAYQ
jgi:hypothetical protein